MYTVAGLSSAQAQTAAKSFVQSTVKEKKDMQDLNDRLGNYLNRVKGLEDQHRRLVTDLDDLRNRWGKDTSHIKFQFAEQLRDARKRMDEAGRQRAQLDVQLARLQDELNNDMRLRYVIVSQSTFLLPLPGEASNILMGINTVID